MFKIIFLCVFLLTVLSILHVGYGDKMGGKGRWIVEYIRQCPDHARYQNIIEISKKRMNRTYDSYDMKFTLVDDLTQHIGVRLEMCIFVDGGECKPFQRLIEASIVRFFDKYAANNIRRAFTMMGKDPPEFPVEKGLHTLEGYMMSDCDFPHKGIFGIFKIKLYFTKISLDISCMEIKAEFTHIDDEWCGEGLE